MDRSQHIIAHISNAILPGTSRGIRLNEPKFCVHWSCECCRMRNSWLTKTELIQQHGMSEAYLRHLEDCAQKDFKEKETKQQVEELLKYLEFADIDFCDPKSTKDFEEVNFVNDETKSDNVTDKDSSSSGDELDEPNSPGWPCSLEHNQLDEEI